MRCSCLLKFEERNKYRYDEQIIEKRMVLFIQNMKKIKNRKITLKKRRMKFWAFNFCFHIFVSQIVYRIPRSVHGLSDAQTKIWEREREETGKRLNQSAYNILLYRSTVAPSIL